MCLRHPGPLCHRGPVPAVALRVFGYPHSLATEPEVGFLQYWRTGPTPEPVPHPRAWSTG